MKKNYLFLFAVLIGNFCCAQIINFPDPNFKAKLLQPSVATNELGETIMIDANGNGEIEIGETQLVYSLNVSNANISDLTGISYFTAIKGLNCSNNLLANLTIDNAIMLYWLDASHNLLTSIDINFNSFIGIGLDLSYNNFTSFTIGSADYYDTINLSHNQLVNLVVEGATIDYLYVNSNNLSSIDAVGNVFISFTADFTNNQFSLLDLTGFIFSNECTVELGNNTVDKVVFGSQPGNISYTSDNAFADFGNFRSITSCDPEYQGNLTITSCPNLEYFILKNGYNHTVVTCDEGGTIFNIEALGLHISNCPNLTFICTDETETPFIQSSINALGLQNQVQVNSYCTFTPGGSFYTLSGITKFDYNADGCDAADFAVPYQKFTIANGVESGTIISDASGNYQIPVGAGTHIITPVIDPDAFTVSPAEITATYPPQTPPAGQNFCVTASAPVHRFQLTLIPLTPAVPGFEANYKLVYKNTGNVIDDGTVILSFADDVLDFISSSVTPAANSGGTISWTFAGLAPFETRTIDLIFKLNTPAETPPLNSGDGLSFTTSAGQTGASTPYPDSHLLNQTIVNSLDPNDKICLEGAIVGENLIGNFVSYKIRFENTGNYAAQNIVVKDVIDTEKFDLSTLEPIIGSHPFYTRITGNNVEFIFENINLPTDDANNDGYAAFKIKTKPTLAVGDTFSNRASIYFDYNFPVVTNDATTAIQLLGNPDFEFSNAFALYPIPAKNTLNIHSKNGVEVKSVAIYNMIGQLLEVDAGNIQAVDVSNLQAGHYFIKVFCENGTAIVKFVKQ